MSLPVLKSNEFSGKAGKQGLSETPEVCLLRIMLFGNGSSEQQTGAQKEIWLQARRPHKQKWFNHNVQIID